MILYIYRIYPKNLSRKLIYAVRYFDSFYTVFRVKGKISRRISFNMNLLIVEDQKELSNSIISYLSNGNYTCDPVYDYNSAFAFFYHQHRLP